MPYEIVYETESGRILAARSSSVPRKDLILPEGQRQLFLSYDFASRPLSAFRVDAEAKTILPREDWVEPERDAILELSTDANSVSPIENIPELPADGKTKLKITVQKLSSKSGQRLAGARHNNRINIRTTAGTLSTRQLNLDKGQASFTLLSSTETVVAEVRVWAEQIPQPAILRVEFAPVE